MHRIEKLNNLSINILEIYFYQDQNKRKHKLIPIETSKNVSDRFEDLLIYRNNYFLTQKLNVFLGQQDGRYISKRSLNTYTSQNMIIKYRQQCNKKEMTSIKTSPEYHVYWKNYFHKNPKGFRICADLEADNEIEISTIGNRTTIFLSKTQYVMDIK